MKFKTFFKLFTCNTAKGDSSPKENLKFFSLLSVRMEV